MNDEMRRARLRRSARMAGDLMVSAYAEGNRDLAVFFNNVMRRYLMQLRELNDGQWGLINP